MNRSQRFIRNRATGEAEVTPLELFFDLVYAFAVTQLAQLLLHNLTWLGVLRTLMLLLAVWWAWVYTAWATNWFHPNQRVTRAVLLGAMLLSLAMSAALPEAFGSRGLFFAVSYVLMQVGRTSYVVWASSGNPNLQRNMQRVLAWLIGSGALWLAGGFANGTGRDLLWLAAVLVDYAAPSIGFLTPRLGRSSTEDWNVSGGHMAERFQLFVIIALGESILDTGSSLTRLTFNATTVAAFVVAFLGSVALWWLYFDRMAGDSAILIAASPDPGRLARSAYTYLHLPIVAGIIGTAVADELVVSHPSGHTDPGVITAVLGGPALFLAGQLLFKLAVWKGVSMPHLIGIAALAALTPVGILTSPLVLATLVTVVTLGIAGWDHVSLLRLARSASERAPS